jgi:hypothetical protein
VEGSRIGGLKDLDDELDGEREQHRGVGGWRAWQRRAGLYSLVGARPGNSDGAMLLPRSEQGTFRWHALSQWRARTTQCDVHMFYVDGDVDGRVFMGGELGKTRRRGVRWHGGSLPDRSAAQNRYDRDVGRDRQKPENPLELLLRPPRSYLHHRSPCGPSRRSKPLSSSPYTTPRPCAASRSGPLLREAAQLSLKAWPTRNINVLRSSSVNFRACSFGFDLGILSRFRLTFLCFVIGHPLLKHGRGLTLNRLGYVTYLVLFRSGLLAYTQSPRILIRLGPVIFLSQDAAKRSGACRTSAIHAYCSLFNNTLSCSPLLVPKDAPVPNSKLR